MALTIQQAAIQRAAILGQGSGITILAHHRKRLGTRGRCLAYATIVISLAVSPAAHRAHGAVSAQEAQQLKTSLTPVGAERAGNAAGTIPAWTGGVTAPPPGYVP